ncbi:MAG TPA: TetR/AcrR family transcriptional regulator, partial [Pseudomonadales bacterium]|nr:TetR/AcrR family transcriptional regulator [Pseudomonadales bacterium]
MASREQWLHAGETLLTGPTPEKITISALCKQLDLTKGSFYHHFEDVNAYRKALNARLKSKSLSISLAKDNQADKKAKWFGVALSILRSQGYACVTLEALITQMQVTKGAFYYLFESRDRFIRELLEFWGEQSLKEMHDLIKQKADDPDTVEKILALSRQMVDRRNIDVQIRAWALTDKHVARYVRKLDQHQLDACRIVLR